MALFRNMSPKPWSHSRENFSIEDIEFAITEVMDMSCYILLRSLTIVLLATM